MNKCQHCESGKGFYDFGLHCCRVRFLFGLPSLDARRGRLARWRMKYEDVSRTQEIFLELWNERSSTKID